MSPPRSNPCPQSACLHPQRYVPSLVDRARGQGSSRAFEYAYFGDEAIRPARGTEDAYSKATARSTPQLFLCIWQATVGRPLQMENNGNPWQN